jgi:hypothetical protein
MNFQTASLCLALFVTGTAYVPNTFGQSGEEDFVENDRGAPENSESEIDRRMDIERPRFRGGGCRPGEVNSVLSPDKKTLSVLFDNFSVTAGGSTGINRARKFCDISVPFIVPEGYRVTVVKLDFRGFNDLPVGARTQLITSYSLGELRGADPARGGQATRRALFTGPLEEDFFVSSRIRPRGARGRHELLRWSQCGTNFDLHVGVSVVTQTNQRAEESMTVIDSVDVASNRVEYALLWRRCDDRVRPPRRDPVPIRRPRLPL